MVAFNLILAGIAVAAFIALGGTSIVKRGINEAKTLKNEFSELRSNNPETQKRMDGAKDI